MLEVTYLPAFNDNYIWLLCNKNTLECAVVDPGNATVVKEWLQTHTEYKLTHILVTHHHHDHTGGVSELKKYTSAAVLGPVFDEIPDIDQTLKHEEIFQCLSCTWQALHVPGHTRGHIAFYCPAINKTGAPLLFCGDTLFSAGCGRIFEGTAEQMLTSITLLTSLPHTTRIYSAHEYTMGNLLFAETIEPNNLELVNYMLWVKNQRAQNLPSLPTSIAVELKINPFLRIHEPQVRYAAEQHAKRRLEKKAEVFAVLREWKNTF